MDDQIKLGFQFAQDFDKQLITISTAVLAFSVTFTKDLFKQVPGNSGARFLGTAWFGYTLSILFGLLQLMALTGKLIPLSKESAVTDVGDGTRFFAICQIVTFFLATLALVAYGALGITRMHIPEAEASAKVTEQGGTAPGTATTTAADDASGDRGTDKDRAPPSP